MVVERVAGPVVGVFLGVMLLAVPSAGEPARAAAATCPDSSLGPVSVDRVIELDTQSPGPLSVRYRPVYGGWLERLAACHGEEELTIVGFVAAPEGLGGVSSFEIEPGWITSFAHFLSATEEQSAEGANEGPFVAVAVPPALEPRFAELAARWVNVRGRLNHPAANDCAVLPTGAPVGPVPTAAEAIAICRAMFVVESIEPLPGMPRTDADVAAGRPADRTSEVPVGWLALAVLVVVAALLAAGRGSSASGPE